MALKVQAIIPLHVLLSKIYIYSADFKESLKVGNSPVEYLYDAIYAEPDIP